MGIQVGDRVVRRTGRNRTVGVVRRIWTVRDGRGDGRRAKVEWLGANRRRLGAESPNKWGSIWLDGLRHVCDWPDCGKPALADDLFCRTHRAEENALWADDEMHTQPE